jgi:hypothetical protein
MAKYLDGLVLPDEIEKVTPSEHLTSVFFGFISGLSNDEFLEYVSRFGMHARVRQVFFSEIQKRSGLPLDLVDDLSQKLLAEIEVGVDRAKNETLIRYLLPHMSKQTRTRTFRSVLKFGTKATRNKMLRRLNPDDAPGLQSEILDIALNDRNEHALVGIVYRWPLPAWKEHAEALFKAAKDLPWLQRQIVFRSEKSDEFLSGGLIDDPVTELYIRARFKRPASHEAIQQARSERSAELEFADRRGLVAWCLGRFSMFDELNSL